MGKAGRPTKLTPETRKKILSTLEVVRRLSDAAFAAGVSPRSVQLWMKQNPDFCAAVKKARRDAKISALRNIRAATPEDWKADAWWLSHMYPEEFAERTKHEHSGPGGKPIPISAQPGLSSLPTEQLAELVLKARERNS